MTNGETVTVSEIDTGGASREGGDGEAVVDYADGVIGRVEAVIADTLNLEPKEIPDIRDEALGGIAADAIAGHHPDASIHTQVAVIDAVEERLGIREGGDPASPLLPIETTREGRDAVTNAIADLYTREVQIAGHDAGVVAAGIVDEMAHRYGLGGDVEMVTNSSTARVDDETPIHLDDGTRDNPYDSSAQSAESFMGVGVNVETGNFDSTLLPRSEDEGLNAIHDKYHEGESLSVGEKMRAGRDTIVTSLGEIQMHTDAAYRSTGLDEILHHISTGRIEGVRGEGDEYHENDDGTSNNNGVDWYLGGVAPRYGEFVIEVPARPDYFQLAFDNGTRLAQGGAARHVKSSGYRHPVPITMANVIFEKDGRYFRVKMEDFPSRMQ